MAYPFVTFVCHHDSAEESELALWRCLLLSRVICLIVWERNWVGIEMWGEYKGNQQSVVAFIYPSLILWQRSFCLLILLCFLRIWEIILTIKNIRSLFLLVFCSFTSLLLLLSLLIIRGVLPQFFLFLMLLDCSEYNVCKKCGWFNQIVPRTTQGPWIIKSDIMLYDTTSHIHVPRTILVI